MSHKEQLALCTGRGERAGGDDDAKMCACRTCHLCQSRTAPAATSEFEVGWVAEQTWPSSDLGRAIELLVKERLDRDSTGIVLAFAKAYPMCPDCKLPAPIHPRSFFRTIVGLWVDWFRLAEAPPHDVSAVAKLMAPHALLSACSSKPLWMHAAVDYAWEVNNRWDNRLSIEELMAREPGLQQMWDRSPGRVRAKLRELLLTILKLSNFLHRTGPTGPSV